MWQLILKAEPPPLPMVWGGLLEKWAKGDVQIPTDLKLDELREHWAEQDPPVGDYTARSASNLRNIINQIKEELPNAPDEVGDLADGLVEVMIKAGKSKGQIKSVIPKLEKLHNQLDPPNKYYDISVGDKTLETLNLVSTKGKTTKDWVIAVLNRLYNNFIKDNSFENLQWLVKVVMEMQKEKPYEGKGDIGKLIKKPKDSFSEKFSKYQSDVDVPSEIINAMKTAFNLTGTTSTRRGAVSTRAGEQVIDPHAWTMDKPIPKKAGELGTHRGGTRYDKTRRKNIKIPQLDPQYLIEKNELLKIVQELTEELKQSPNSKNIKRELKEAQKKYDDFVSQERKLAPLKERVERKYELADDVEAKIVNISATAFRNLFDDLVKAGVHDKLEVVGHTPLTWFEKRAINTLHSLAFGDAVTQPIASKFTPVDKIYKDIDPSLRETRKVNQIQFIEKYIEQQKKQAGEAAFDVEGVPLNTVGETDADGIYIGPEESRMVEAVDKLSKVLTQGTNADLNEAWNRYLRSSKTIGGEAPEHSLEEKHETISSDDVETIFGLQGEGVFKRNLFITYLFDFYDSEDTIDGEPQDEWVYNIRKKFKPPTGPINEADMPTEADHKATDAPAFLKRLKTLLTFIKIWLGNAVSEEYNNRLNDTIAKFGDNIEQFIDENADELDEDADDKREILITAFSKEPESFNKYKGDWFGIKDDLTWLETELNKHFKTIAGHSVPQYFKELFRQIGTDKIVSGRGQRVTSKGEKVSIKEKLLDLGYLTRE